MESVNNDKIVVFRTYKSEFEANVVKELLASNGIPSMIKNDQTNVFMPVFTPMTGVKLMVFEKDMPSILEIVDGAKNSDDNK